MKTPTTESKLVRLTKLIEPFWAAGAETLMLMEGALISNLYQRRAEFHVPAWLERDPHWQLFVNAEKQ